MSQDNTNETAFLAPGTKLNGRYVIERVIGQGGFGITYYARHEMLMHVYAIKEFYISGYNTRDTVHNTISLQGMQEDMYAKYKTRFVEEARTVVSLDHPNIVKVVDIFEENNTAYMVMPFVEGTSLQKLVEKNGGRLPYELTVNYMGQLSAAVGYIHSKHILHRDIKPDNVLITPDNKVILIDFGSAREFVNDKTQRHTSILTHGYAPPEQYSSVSRKGNYTDIYALGGVYYFCLTGEVPVEATTRLLEAGEGNDPLVEPKALNSNVTDNVNRTIMKAMALKPEKRHQSVEEFMDDLLGRGASTKPAETPKQEPAKTPEVKPASKHEKKQEPVKEPEKKQEYKSVFAEPKPQSKPKSEGPKEPKKKGKAGLWIGLGSAMVALVLVLVFALNDNYNDIDASGAINTSGAFSVGPNKQVVFSMGNLQYQASTKTYRFANNQWDVLGTKAASSTEWMDLFGWGTGNNPTKDSFVSEEYDEFYDWGHNTISNGGDLAWRTLTAQEWDYIINGRNNIYGNIALAVINDEIYGLMLFPDNWDHYIVDYYSEDGLIHIDSKKDLSNSYEKYGAVFLPAIVNGEDALYWSATPYEQDYAFMLNASSVNPTDWDYRSSGACVRLVCDMVSSANLYGSEILYEDQELEKDEIFISVEEMPDFPGGSAKLIEYIQKNLRYPMSARENDTQGKVFVGFVVEKDGSISDVKVLRGIGDGCDEEAVRVVQSLPKFNPGKQNGNPVRVQYTLPIVFSLQ